MFKKFIQNEIGAITTVEILGYTFLIGGAAALIGYGLTTLTRGKIGDFQSTIEDTKAMSDPITRNSGYTGTPDVDNETGIIKGMTGN